MQAYLAQRASSSSDSIQGSSRRAEKSRLQAEQRVQRLWSPSRRLGESGRILFGQVTSLDNKFGIRFNLVWVVQMSEAANASSTARLSSRTTVKSKNLRRVGSNSKTGANCPPMSLYSVQGKSAFCLHHGLPSTAIDLLFQIE